jgi:hypothetical protein
MLCEVPQNREDNAFKSDALLRDIFSILFSFFVKQLSFIKQFKR